jgi:peptidoglycan hydrolase-like protein with peptidoglycan-binding domain
MTPQEMQMLLGRLGFTPPAEMTPQDMEAAMALFEEVPQSVMAAALNPGTGVSFSADTGGMGSVRAEATMSEVQTGPGFEQTQAFSLSVERQQSGLGLLEPGLASRYASLPEPIRERVSRWGISFEDGVRVDLGAVSLGMSPASGERLTYEAVVPPEIGEKIAAGDLSAAPDPTNPMTMPVGSSVVIRGEAFESNTFEFSRGSLGFSETISELEGQGLGIKRVDERVFEVTRGPIDAIERNTSITIGSDEYNVGVVSDLRVEDESLSIARIDLGTAEGQQAYLELMQTGKVPDQTGPGILRTGETESLSIDTRDGLEANLGSVSIDTVSETANETASTRWDDGSGEYNAERFSYGDGLYMSASTLPDGSIDESSRRWTVTYDDISEENAQMLQMAFSTDGNGQPMPETVHTEMRFTDSELMEFRDRARDYVSQTNPELLAKIDAGTTETPTDYIPRLAAATTPEEVFTSAFEGSWSNSDIAQNLVTLRMEGNNDVVPPPLAGELELRDESLGLLFEKTRPASPPDVNTEAPVLAEPSPIDEVTPIVPGTESEPTIEGTPPSTLATPETSDQPPVVPVEPSVLPPVVDSEAPVLAEPSPINDVTPIVPSAESEPTIEGTPPSTLATPELADQPPVVPVEPSVLPPVVDSEAPVLAEAPRTDDVTPIVPSVETEPTIEGTPPSTLATPELADQPPVVPVEPSVLPPVVDSEAPVLTEAPPTDDVTPIVPSVEAEPTIEGTPPSTLATPETSDQPPVEPSVLPPAVDSTAPDLQPPVVNGVRPSFGPGGLPPAVDSTAPDLQPPVVNGVRPSFGPGGLPPAVDSTAPDLQPPVVNGVRPSFGPGGLPPAVDSTPPTVQPPAYDLADGVLKSGDEGIAVLGVQTALNNLGYNVPADMKFDTETDLAVRDFQGRQGLKVDGIVGPNTFEALTEANRELELGRNASSTFVPSTNLDVQDGLIRRREEGIGVLGAQTALDNLGYDIAADMKFGAETDRTIREFQAAQGLEVDGIVGPLTSAALVEANREREQAESRGGVDGDNAPGNAIALPATQDTATAYVPADPTRPGDPDHDNYMRATAAVHRLDASMNRTPDAASECLIASATCLARENEMRIDHLMLSSGNGRAAKGEHLIIVEGELEDPNHRKASMRTQTAVETSVADTFASIDRARQDEAARAKEKEIAIAIVPEQETRAPGFTPRA